MDQVHVWKVSKVPHSMSMKVGIIMMTLSLAVIFKHRLYNDCPLYGSLRSEQIVVGSILGKGQQCPVLEPLPQCPVLEPLLLLLMTARSPQFWFPFTFGLPMSLVWTFLFYLLINQLPNFLPTPEIWTLSLAMTQFLPDYSFCSTLSAPCLGRHVAAEGSEGSMLMSGSCIPF